VPKIESCSGVWKQSLVLANGAAQTRHDRNAPIDHYSCHGCTIEYAHHDAGCQALSERAISARLFVVSSPEAGATLFITPLADGVGRNRCERTRTLKWVPPSLIATMCPQERTLVPNSITGSQFYGQQPISTVLLLTASRAKSAEQNDATASRQRIAVERAMQTRGRRDERVAEPPRSRAILRVIFARISDRLTADDASRPESRA